MDHINILNNDDDKQSINRISGKSVGNLDTLDYDLFKSVLLKTINITINHKYILTDSERGIGNHSKDIERFTDI